MAEQKPHEGPAVALHRFHDCAALSVLRNPKGATVYLDAKETRELARALARLARSLEREAFRDSVYGSPSFPAAFHAL